MNSEKKKQLFPFFAYLYSQQLNPEKYANAKDFEEWSNILNQSPEDVEEITKAAAQLSDDDWVALEQQYEAELGSGEPANESAITTDDETTFDSVEMAKKGAKLKTLQSYKKGKSMTKKCSCGCDLITVKESGGKLTTKCACGCGGKMKKEEGGKINEKVLSMKKKVPAFKQNKK